MLALLTSLGHVQHQRERESISDCPSLRLAFGIQVEAERPSGDGGPQQSIIHSRTHTRTHPRARSAPSSQCWHAHTTRNVLPRRTHAQGFEGFVALEGCSLIAHLSDLVKVTPAFRHSQWHPLAGMGETAYGCTPPNTIGPHIGPQRLEKLEIGIRCTPHVPRLVRSNSPGKKPRVGEKPWASGTA